MPSPIGQATLVSAEDWRSATNGLASDAATLASLWGDEDKMRMALVRPGGALEVLDLACDGGAFPSVAAVHAPAGRLERAACDLFGFVATGAPDPRPWLDHGRWLARHPLGRAIAHDGSADAYAFLPVQGSGLHQIPVGSRRTRGSSSLATSASTPAARRWCGSKSGSAMSTRASTP